MAAAATGEVGDSLPPDPIARPSNLDPPAAPEAVAAALAAAVAAHLETPPAASAGVAAPISDLRPLPFGAKRPVSQPDRVAYSLMPSPTWVSLPGSPAIAEPAPEREPPVAKGGGAAGPAQEPPLARGGGVAGPAQDFIMPFERGRVTSMFNQGRYHPAIDLAGPLGTPVHATTRRQRVVFTGWRGGYGNTVMTRDDRGRTHLYGHLLSIGTRVGRMLDQGQTLGALGSTGHSTGPHVHYEVRASSGGHINPVTLLFPGRRVGRGYAWRNPAPPAVAERSVVAGYPRPR